MSANAAIKLRCAVYTRKSSEEGLEQSFNSLHAQREACEAYIKSQAGEGWRLVVAEYDDGGFSGGNMDRPALTRLLSDIDRGLVDIVVVYKVDRLTRSLTDFAKIVDTFDRRGVSFVSITQAFNTTTSMGRLTLNVLLSFAQFEREVTGERIRDKIAQSKARGLWMGGVLPLGYDCKDHVLVVNPTEANTVRSIFELYVELGSVEVLLAELDRRGIRSKSWVTKAGRTVGGQKFGRGALYHLLQNHHYRGLIRHKHQTFPGLHAAIVEEALFEEVQRKLVANRVQRRMQTVSPGKAPLLGLLFDEEGKPFTPTFSRGRANRTYRYYVAGSAGQTRRLPSAPVEALVLQQLRRATGKAVEAVDFQRMINRLEVRPASLVIILPIASICEGERPDLALRQVEERLADTDQAALDETGSAIRISIATKLRFRGGRTWLSGVKAAYAPRKPRVNKSLVRGLREAHATLSRLQASPLEEKPMVASKAPVSTYHARLAKLAFLAPDIQHDILTGRQPESLSIKQLLNADIPLAWADQRRWIREM